MQPRLLFALWSRLTNALVRWQSQLTRLFVSVSGFALKELIAQLRCSPHSDAIQEIDMPAIIMWLLGVPLVVIVLLYLIF